MRRPEELDVLEAWDELSSYRMRSSGGGGVKGPLKTRANEVAGAGAVLVGGGAEFVVRATESAGGGSADTGAGATAG